MKNLLLTATIAFAIGALSPACAPLCKSKTTTPTTKDTPKPLQDYSKVSPGTCVLQLNNLKIHSQNKNHIITGQIQTILGYGAGFTSVFQTDQTIQLEISEKQAQKIQSPKAINCTIQEEMQMGSAQPIFRLIKIQNH